MGIGHSHLANEAESDSLALRLTGFCKRMPVLLPNALGAADGKISSSDRTR
jgi:hypothetical protein